MTKKEKKAGLIAGFALIIMALAAGFSYGYVQNQLLGESAERTAQNLAEHKSLFLSGIAGWLLVLLTDIIVAGTLFLFFRRENWRASILAASIRVLYTMVFGVAIYRLVLVASLINLVDSAGKIQNLIHSFENIWSAGLIIFGFHLVVLGFLSLRSSKVPNFLGFLLCFGGISYTLINAAKQLAIVESAIVKTVEGMLALPMALSELSLAFWLLYKGIRKPKNN